MKRTLPILLLAASVLSSAAATRTETFVFSFDPDAVAYLALEDGTELPRLDGTELPSGDPGKPWLPVKDVAIRLPAGFAATGVSVSATWRVLREGVDVAPEQEPHPTDRDASQVARTPKDAAAYASVDPFPGAAAALAGSHRMRGMPFATVRLRPFSYVAASKTLRLATSIEVAVEMDDGAPAPAAGGEGEGDSATAAPPAVDAFDAPDPGGRFSAALDAMAVNPLPPAPEAGPSGDVPVPTAGSCTYLVITSENLGPVFRRLVDYRAEKDGVTGGIVTVQAIDAAYEGARPDGGSDIQTKIRDCIKDYVRNRGTEYVCLAGDDTVVPDRDTYVSASGLSHTDMPTDLYYSDLDGTWDGDRDGVYGETNDGVDLAPDVVVGRIPVRTAQQAVDYLSKLFAYEAGAADDSWRLSKFLLGGAMTQHFVGSSSNGWPRATEAFNDGLPPYDGRGTVASDVEVWGRRCWRDWFAKESFGLVPWFFYDTVTSADASSEGDYAQTSANLVEQWSRGFHFGFWFAHGQETGFAIEGAINQFSTGNAAKLSDLVAFQYTCACLTGAFDERSYDPCLSEAFLRDPDGGSIGYLGCSREGWGSYISSSTYGGDSPEFGKAYYAKVLDEGVGRFGDAVALSKATRVGSASSGTGRWLMFGLNAQGDPMARLFPPAETRPSVGTPSVSVSGSSAALSAVVSSIGPAVAGSAVAWFEVSVGDPSFASPSVVAAGSLSGAGTVSAVAAGLASGTVYARCRVLNDAGVEAVSAPGASSGAVSRTYDAGHPAVRIERIGPVSADGTATVRAEVGGTGGAVTVEWSESPTFEGARSLSLGTVARGLSKDGTVSGLAPGAFYYVRAKIAAGGATVRSANTTCFAVPPDPGTLCRISGTVLALDGDPACGLEVVAEPGGFSAAVGEDGSYAFDVPQGWSGTVSIRSEPVVFPAQAAISVGTAASWRQDFSVDHVLRVRLGADGKGDGSSWDDAFPSLAPVLARCAADAAWSGGRSWREVWVAAGAYAPGEDAASSFIVPNGIELYGGFAGTETARSQRDWIANPTALSGEIGDPDSIEDNVRILVRGFGKHTSSLVDGFAVTRAFVPSGASSSALGNGDSSLVDPELDWGIVFDHCLIADNESRGYIGIAEGPLVFRNCVVTGNRNTKSDARLFQDCLLDNCTFFGNSSGGSIAFLCTLHNTVLWDNEFDGSDYLAMNAYFNRADAPYAGYSSDRWIVQSTTWSAGTRYTTAPGFAEDPETGLACALAPGSFAVDKGKALPWMAADSVDYLGNPRVAGASPDIGAFECPEQGPTAPRFSSVALGEVTYRSVEVSATLRSLGNESTSADLVAEVSRTADFATVVATGPAVSATAPKVALAVSASGLADGTDYYVRVRATGSNGRSATSDALPFTTADRAIPSASVALGTPELFSIPVSWRLTNVGLGNASATVTLEWGPTPACGSSAVVGTFSAETEGSYEVTGLPADAVCFVRVRVDTAPSGRQFVSEPVSARTRDYGPPVASASVPAVLARAATVRAVVSDLGEAASSATVHVDWGRADYGSTGVAGTLSAPGTVEFRISGLEPSSEHRVRVRVVNDLGRTGTATATFSTTEPDDPAFSVAVAPSYTSASFSAAVTRLGGGASSASGYVRWGSSSSISPELGRAPFGRIVSAPDTLAAAATGLSTGTQYWYEAVVTNDVSGLATATGSFTTKSAPTLAWGEGYWEGGLLQGYRKGAKKSTVAVDRGSVEAARWNSSGLAASFAYGAVASWQKSGTTWSNPADGSSYQTGQEKYGCIWAYGGQMWMEAGTTYHFAVNYAYSASISIDGAVVCSEESGGTATPSTGSVTPSATGWHDVAVAVADGNAASGAAVSTGSPFHSLGYGAAWNTNGLATVTSSNASQWRRLLDAGDRRLFRARGRQGESAFLDQTPTWTKNSLTVPVRIDSLVDGMALTVYITRNPNAWYFTERWERSATVASVPDGASVQSVTFSGIDTTTDWYVSARLSDGSKYDQWTDPVKWTPVIASFEKPTFSVKATDGVEPMVFGGTASSPKVSITINNASADAAYGVYASDTVDGTYSRVSATQRRSGGLLTFEIPVSSSSGTKFFQIKASATESDLP